MFPFQNIPFYINYIIVKTRIHKHYKQYFDNLKEEISYFSWKYKKTGNPMFIIGEFPVFLYIYF